MKIFKNMYIDNRISIIGFKMILLSLLIISFGFIYHDSHPNRSTELTPTVNKVSPKQDSDAYIAPVVNAPPTNTAQTQSATSSGPSGYVPSLCTTSLIPYTTVTQVEPTLLLSQSYTTPGSYGKNYFCTKTSTSAGMDSTVQPINAMYHMGTKVQPVSLEPYPSVSSGGHSVSQCQVIPPGSSYDYCVQTATGP